MGRLVVGKLAIQGMLLSLLGPCCAEVKAQSFLEKLEQAVREQLAQPPSGPGEQSNAGSSEELPAPKSQSGIERDAATAGKRAGSERVGSEQNAASSAMPPTTEGNSPASGGQIYLGLEAEETIDGGIGVRVSNVTRDSPAWKAGFEVGDRILAVNGFAIANLSGLVEQLTQTRPGDSVRFLVNRLGRNLTLTAVLMDSQLAAALRGSPSVEDFESESLGNSYLGVRVNDLTSAFRSQFGISVYRGAAVSEVAAGSPASQVGIRAGDAIVEAGGRPIESADDLLSWVASTRPGQQAELIVYRGNFARSVELVLSAAPGSQSVSNNRASEIGQPTRSRPNVVAPPVAVENGSRDPLVVPPPIQLQPSDGGQTLQAGNLQQNTQPNRAGEDSLSLNEQLELLQQENDQLLAELEATREQLRKTEAKLQKILELLDRDP